VIHYVPEFEKRWTCVKSRVKSIFIKLAGQMRAHAESTASALGLL
jgi:hypothetical protein